jgi:arginyl-tRNA synthetase
MDIKEEIKDLLRKTLEELGIDGIEPVIERPKDTVNGDFSTSIALAGFQKSDFRSQMSDVKSSKDLAEKIVKELGKNKNSFFEKIEVAGPGFINFYLSKEYLQKQVGKIIKAGNEYGSIDIGKGQNASVEYVSANPTGPLHIGNARGGPIGDVLANALSKAGYKVTKEYLHNNVGGQIHQLGATIGSKIGFYRGIISSEGERERELAYQGTYIEDLSKRVKSKLKELGEDKFDMYSYNEQCSLFGSIAAELMRIEILRDCELMGIKFDKVVYESELKKDAPEVIQNLQKQGFVKEKDGALWFAPNDEFLKDRETVVKKSDGEYTYFASDIVYHKQKFQRNQLVIDIWGSNHSGHVPRMKAAIKALGFDPDKFTAVLYQFVRVKRGEEVVKMSKRAGNFITAREVLEEVGKDAFRFFMLMHKAETHMDFDLDLAKKRASDNPVFYVQYAHSRICSIFIKAQEFGLRIQEADLTLLKTEEEIALMRHLLKLPELIREIVKTFGVNSLTAYAIEIASLFHHFYEKQIVISKEEQLSKARLALLSATQVVLKNTLDLLGVSAPEKM